MSSVPCSVEPVTVPRTSTKLYGFWGSMIDQRRVRVVLQVRRPAAADGTVHKQRVLVEPDPDDGREDRCRHRYGVESTA